jgi:hypothetical protein
VRRFALVTLLALIAAACADESACDPTSALPVVSVDVAALEANHDLDTLEVCMDGQCAHPGETTEPLLFGEETQARFLVSDNVPDVVDDAPAVKILVRTETGELLLAPTAVELTRVYPNGERCGGDAWQGWFEVTADGALIEVART